MWLRTLLRPSSTLQRQLTAVAGGRALARTWSGGRGPSKASMFWQAVALGRGHCKELCRLSARTATIQMRGRDCGMLKCFVSSSCHSTMHLWLGSRCQRIPLSKESTASKNSRCVADVKAPTFSRTTIRGAFACTSRKMCKMSTPRGSERPGELEQGVLTGRHNNSGVGVHGGQ